MATNKHGSMASWIAWALFAVVAASAIVRAMLPGTPADQFRADDETRREAFSLMAGYELAVRSTSIKKFPGDRWSQDDDYHALEVRKAVAFANLRGLSAADVLRAIDDGLREGWPRPGQGALSATVPPCHPRPVY